MNKTLQFRPNPFRMKAAIYIRVSTAKQAKEGNGLEDQLNRCKAILTVKDWDLYEVYCNEKGISGTTEIKDRKELNDLMEDAKNGLFNCVVFNSLDRLGRSTKIILGVIESFTEMGIKIYSCKESIDTSTASGELMLTFFAGIAQYERRLIVERMAAGKAVVTAKYGEKGGPLPLGYRRGEDGHIDIHPEEAAIVRNIFIARSKGLSLRKIAMWLTNLGIKTKKAKKWYGSTVGVILKNKPKYEGQERNGNENGVCWPKILFYTQHELDEIEATEKKYNDEIDEENSNENSQED